MKTFTTKAIRPFLIILTTIALTGCAANAPSMQDGKMSMESKCSCCNKMKTTEKTETKKGCCCGCCNKMGGDMGKMCTPSDGQKSVEG